MAQKKAHEVDAWLRRPAEGVAIVLLYGPDRGLVSERAMAFARQTGLPLDDPFSVVRLEAGEAEQGRLLEEAGTVPMFSSRRLLWVRNAGAQKSLADDVKTLSSNPARDAVILIEAGELKKGAALRTVVEGSATGMALPCYVDEARAIDQVIDDELGKSGVGITIEARAALRNNLGGDRLATRAEISKLALYAHGQPRIELEDVLALIGDVSGTSVDDAVDAVLEGKVADFDMYFTRHALGAGQVYPILAGAMRQFQALQLMSSSMTGGRNAAAVVAAAKPPVFFARRKVVERALERWSQEALQRCLARLQAAILATRRQPSLASEITRHTLLAIAVEASRLGYR